MLLRKIGFVLGFAWVFLLAPSGFAFEIPPMPNTYVSDFAKLMNPTQRAQLESKLQQIEQKGSSQVLVVTVTDLQGLALEDYSIRLAEKWKPGQKGRDNGVILLVAPQERKVRIEVGYGLEAVLTDALSASITQQEILPFFRKGDFYQGILQGVQGIEQAIAGEYEPMARAQGANPYFRFFGIFIAMLIFAMAMRFLRGRRGYGYSHSGWSSGFGGGGSSSGFSGGFSSGGGSFGGGGASGSW